MQPTTRNGHAADGSAEPSPRWSFVVEMVVLFSVAAVSARPTAALAVPTCTSDRSGVGLLPRSVGSSIRV